MEETEGLVLEAEDSETERAVEIAKATKTAKTNLQMLTTLRKSNH